ncbi:MAG: hypothetical protein OXI30_12155 [Chloroflexota bacterium]|nr:hypothetical protein [Chloroflexota bacterium]
MDLIVLLKELSSTGISDFVIVGVALLVVRYWFSETRREISKEIDDKVGALKTDLEPLIKENRQELAAFRTETRQEFGALRTEMQQEVSALRTETRLEFNESRATSEQSHKETMLHLIDVRERLANIEGRLGAPTPRMSAVSPPLETSAEEPSAQS